MIMNGWFMTERMLHWYRSKFFECIYRDEPESLSDRIMIERSI